MYPGHWGKTVPEKPAVIMSGSGETISHAALDERSNRLAQLLWGAGIRPGDHIALLLENHPRYLEIVWAALRSGLLVTPVNRYLTAEEAGFVVDHSDARVLVSSAGLAEVAIDVARLAPQCQLALMVDGVAPGFESYEELVGQYPAEPLAEEPLGETLLFSSGSTGRPKGVAKPLSGAPASSGVAFNGLLSGLFGFDEGSVYLSTAPLYHAAPLGFSVSATSLGGTVVVMEQFEASEALAAIARFGVTHSQWVPTMFTRLLRLPDDERAGIDLSRHRVAIHAAAPCPRPVKEAMFAWWGPILHEYYGGTELNGATYAGPHDWLAHPGTVGRAALGTVHICDESGDDVAPHQVGTVYFELPVRNFEYYKDPGGTTEAEHPRHPNWTTLGDVGYLDDDGFLYLTDRATFMIVSGGVNIYPQEVENCLAMHPMVEDVAVFGIPNDEMGEEVKAAVQLRAGIDPTPELEAELLDYARARLAHYKCPRTVDFEAELPRLPTGKLYKLALRDPYWKGRVSRIV